MYQDVAVEKNYSYTVTEGDTPYFGGNKDKQGYTFPMGLDTESTIYKKYAQTYIPRNFLIDKEGKVVKASVGYDEAEFAELVKLIDETIKK
mgnify:CR=1 FL=1